MSSFIRPIANSLPLTRTATIAALLGTALAFSPMIPAHADSGSKAQTVSTQGSSTKPAAAAAATRAQPENVEQRITNLHAALQITSDEEPRWNTVAQAMRDNAASIGKLIAAKRAQSPQSMTALDDLKTYQDFAQAHVDGLKNLSSAFKALYDPMPDAQKKTADQVFQNFGREPAPAHG